MAPAKKTTPPARKAVKKPVLNLKATEVKSAADKSDKSATNATASDKAKAATTGKPGKSCKPGEAPMAKPVDKAKANSSGKKPSVADKKPATTKKPEPTKKTAPQTKKKSGKGALVLVSLAALVAAGLGGAWAFKTYGAKYFADPNAVSTEKFNAAMARIEKLEAGLNNAASGTSLKAATDDLRKQLAASKSVLTANQKAIAENQKKLAELEKTAREIRVALAKAAEENTGPVAVANKLQFSDLSAKISSLEKSLADMRKTAGGQSGKELSELKTRFDALLIRLSAAEEQASAAARSASLVQKAQEELAKAPASNPASELARAFTILRAQVSRGEPFEAALDDVAGKLPDAPDLDALRPMAKAGVPTLARLKAALADISITKPAPEPSADSTKDDSVMNRLTSGLTGLVKVTRAGEADWDDLKAKALKALEAGELSGAVSALRGGGNAPDSVKSWLMLAGQKAKADKAIENLSATIVARLKAAQ